jgi:hypothetical protein
MMQELVAKSPIINLVSKRARRILLNLTITLKVVVTVDQIRLEAYFSKGKIKIT